MCMNCVYEKLLHIEFLFHSRWLKNKIQTTKSNNPIGLNFLKEVYTQLSYSCNDKQTKDENQNRVYMRPTFFCDLLIVNFSTQIMQGKKTL